MNLKFFFLLWALSPIFAQTYDENYGDYNYDWSSEERKRKTRRFSLFQLRLGKVTYYFLTFDWKEREHHFHWAYKIKLDECQWAAVDTCPMAERNEHIEALSKRYIDEHLETLPANSQTIQVEKEFLQYLQENLSYRKSLSYNKMNFYTTIILVFIPLAPSFYDKTFSANIQNSTILSLIYCVLAIFLLYALLNWGALAFQYMAVSGIKKSSFHDMKQPPENRSSIVQQLYSYYHDWQQERFYTDLCVAYVKQTELAVKCTAALLIILALIGPITNALDKSNTVQAADETVYLYSINADNLQNPFSSDSLEIAELHMNIRKYRPEGLVIIIGEQVSSETFALLKENFDQYEGKFETHTYVDQALSPGEFKIAIIGG